MLIAQPTLPTPFLLQRSCLCRLTPSVRPSSFLTHSSPIVSITGFRIIESKDSWRYARSGNVVTLAKVVRGTWPKSLTPDSNVRLNYTTYTPATQKRSTAALIPNSYCQEGPSITDLRYLFFITRRPAAANNKPSSRRRRSSGGSPTHVLESLLVMEFPPRWIFLRQ